MPRTKIAFVAPRFYPCLGGYERYIGLLARDLALEGHDVRVFTTNAIDLEYFWVPDRAHLPIGEENHEKVRISRLPISHAAWRRRAQRLLGFAPIWKWQAQFRRPAFAVPGLRAGLLEFAPEIVHIGPLPYTRMMYDGVSAAKCVSGCLVATPCTHFGPEGSTAISRHYTRSWHLKLLNRCDRIFTLTEAERSKLEHLGVPTEKLFFGGAGIELTGATGGSATAFRKGHNLSDPIVVSIGTKAPEKGTFALIDAMRMLWEKRIDAVLVLAGASLLSFEQHLARLKLPPGKLINLGTISDSEKHDLLAAADVVAQPSCVESLGLVYLEAWANKKPVIAADMAVTREVISDGEDGLLTPFGDSRALAETIEKLLTNPQLRKSMGERGRNKVQQRFLWESASERIRSQMLK
jgi:glycosyltransferase involved in cell wall biosynthesis